MMRFLFWTLLSILTLGMMSFDVTYSDGLRIKSKGWPEAVSEWRKKRKKGVDNIKNT